MPSAPRNLARLDERLAGTGFGPVEWHAEIDSTNRAALDAARRGHPGGLVIVADEQTAGRGRLGRSWVAPPGASLLVSVLLRQGLDPDRRGLLTLTAGIAAAEAVEQLSEGRVVPGLKWPNDLVVADRKLAGILAEADGDAVVVGMGLNVDWPEVPAELDGIATSISLEGGGAPDRSDVLAMWLVRWHGWLEILAAPAGPERVRSAWCRRSATLGRQVRVELGDEVVEGVAEDLADSGHLIVRDEADVWHEIAAGDVVHLRPI